MNDCSLIKLLYIRRMEKSPKKEGILTRGKIKDKRAAILNAALSLITSNGFHGTSMKMIAEKAEIATGTIYVHFADKEEMIINLYEEIGQEINAIISELLRNDDTFHQKFISIWTAILKLYIVDPRKPEFISQYAYSPYITTTQGKSDNKLFEPIVSFFEEAKKADIIKNMPFEALIALSHSPIASFVRMAKYEKIQLTDLEVKNYSQACWDAIKNN
jgi:AcrR family transcriptional regulator